MAVQVIVTAIPQKYIQGYDPAVGAPVEVTPGTTVRELVESLGIPESDVKLVMVDGVSAGWDRRLSGGERVALFPPVGGG